MGQDHDREGRASQSEDERRARVPRDALGFWLESQRLTNQMLRPAPLDLLDQRAWLKMTTMPDVAKLFSPRDLDFMRSVVGDYERTRRSLVGVNATVDVSRHLRKLTVADAFPALREATLAQQRIARLMAPLDFGLIS